MALQFIVRNGFSQKILRRLASTNSFSSKILFVESLCNRVLLRVTGDEAKEYLQGLITNDMNILSQSSECMYAMFLNSKGRVLYDTIVYKTNDSKTYIVEIDSTALNSLLKHLLMFRVRRKISIKQADDIKVWVMSNNTNLTNVCSDSITDNVLCFLKPVLNDCLVNFDPRISDLGLRIIAPKETDLLCNLQRFPEFQFHDKCFYKSLRYKLGIGEGVAELPPGQSFPLEANCDYLNGVSFQKGCYIGQELTARTYHTGVIRKRLMPITLHETLCSNEMDIPIFVNNANAKPIGKLKGIEGKDGIALLRTEEALKSSNMTILDKICSTRRPFWWPSPST